MLHPRKNAAMGVCQRPGMPAVPQVRGGFCRRRRRGPSAPALTPATGRPWSRRFHRPIHCHAQEPDRAGSGSRQVTIGGRAVTGTSKGGGMIRPNTATMLGFVATDAVITPAALQQLVREAADASFNRITIDGDTSTYVSFMLMATLQAGQGPIVALDSSECLALRGRHTRQAGMNRAWARPAGRDAAASD